MDSARMALSTALLQAVLGGMTYDAAARDHGVTRTAVERRVKALVLELIRTVGVDGLNESRAAYVRKLRAHRASIELALARYEPAQEPVKLAAPMVLSDEDIQAALRRVRAHTSTPERDLAMVWILLATGLRPLEIARLEVGDYLNADGSVRIRSKVRADVAVNGRLRPLYFSSSLARDAIDAYLTQRVATPTQNAGDGVRRGFPYRGLDPTAALILTQAGRAFVIESVRSASGMRSLCSEIHYTYRKIFRRIGIPGLSALRVRYTVMDRLARRGAELCQIGELLGVREPRAPKRARLGLSDLMDDLV